jgi:hypothetical protein
LRNKSSTNPNSYGGRFVRRPLMLFTIYSFVGCMCEHVSSIVILSATLSRHLVTISGLVLYVTQKHWHRSTPSLPCRSNGRLSPPLAVQSARDNYSCDRRIPRLYRLLQIQLVVFICMRTSAAVVVVQSSPWLRSLIQCHWMNAICFVYSR